MTCPALRGSVHEGIVRVRAWCIAGRFRRRPTPGALILGGATAARSHRRRRDRSSLPLWKLWLAGWRCCCSASSPRFCACAGRSASAAARAAVPHPLPAAKSSAILSGEGRRAAPGAARSRRRRCHGGVPRGGLGGGGISQPRLAAGGERLLRHRGREHRRRTARAEWKDAYIKQLPPPRAHQRVSCPTSRSARRRHSRDAR